MIKRYGASVSPCSTPATMSKYSVSPSGDVIKQIRTLLLCRLYLDFCQQVSTLGHCQGKSFMERKEAFLESF